MKRRIITLGLVVTGLFMSLSANATLIKRGDDFVYDDVLGITWTQDANINGTDTWANQIAWAASLSIVDTRPGAGGVTYSDWRLPSANLNLDSTIVDCDTAPELACRDNEYGYMFFQNGVTPSSPDLFTKLQAEGYWSSTESDSTTAEAFFFGGGLVGITTPFLKTNNAFAWAVRDDDVAAAVVPVPAAVWLFGSALAMLGWMRRKAA
jgi:hypothetical protein